jgi:quercetin dioxygenase-like cupin family protein
MIRHHRPAILSIAVLTLVVLGLALYPHPPRADEPAAADQAATAGVQWKPLPALPPGARITTLRGSSSKPGPYVIRVQFPPNYRVPPHSHSDNRTYTVISGTLYEAKGEKFDDARLDRKPAGSFEVYVAGDKHFDATKGDGVILQIQGYGPSTLTYVDPAQDPRGVAGAAPAAPGHRTLRPDQLRWEQPPPTTPCGAKMAVLDGDPRTEGSLFTLRLRFPAGCRIMPHFHPSEEHVTVISGEFAMGMGDVHDEARLEPLPAGGFAIMPAAMHHFALARTESVIQLHAIGPFKTTYVNPADDPRNQTSTR